MNSDLQSFLIVIAKSIVVSLAVSFIARLTTRERGPFRILALWRELIDRLLNLGRLGRELHELLSCPFCLSVWLSAIGALIVWNLWVFPCSVMLAWIWLEVSMTPSMPDDKE